MNPRRAIFLASTASLLLATSVARAQEIQITDPIAPPPIPMAGYADTGFYLHDSKDFFRLYPRGRMYLDFGTTAGPSVPEIAGSDGGSALGSKFSVRRLRLELAGDLFQARVSFLASVDLGGQSITNVNGKAQNYASKVGEAPTATTARFSAIETAAPTASLADVWVNVKVVPQLQFMIGQYQTPFSLENRIAEGNYQFMERNFAMRSFVIQSQKESGITAWGVIDGGTFNYEVMVSGGDGSNRPNVDSRVDFFGRVFARPFAHSSDFEYIQVGASAHHGDRDPKSVGYDLTQITTNQGFVLWDPTYKDSLGRTMHILPSGAQDAIGGELRVPIGRFDLRGEAYYVRNQTREAVDGYQLTSIERTGTMRGVGWYATISAWPFGDSYVMNDNGISRPRVLDLTNTKPKVKRGLETLVTVSGVNAHYDGASRAGVRDPKTPDGDITIYNVGVGANYWVTRHFRASFNYMRYDTPGSGSKDNLAVVPGNASSNPSVAAGSHVIHELGGRIWLQF